MRIKTRKATMIKFTAILFSTLLLTACIGSNQVKNELPLPPKPITHPAFTLLPPAEQGWLLANMSQYNLSLAKRGSTRDESYAIQVMLFQLPAFKDNNEFKEFVSMDIKKDTNKTRFKNIKSNSENVSINNLNCIKNIASTEDTQATKESNNTNNMILDAVSYTCQHPTVSRAAANISYSHRHYPGNSDASLEKASRVIIENFKFN